MKNRLIALSVLTAALMCGCADNRKVLHVYNWEDYISPELISKFETENNCRVTITTFDSNESMIAKFLAGSTGYDVVFPSSYAIPVMIENDLLAKLDLALLPNVIKNFDEQYRRFLLDTNMTYSVPYAFSMTGLAYVKNKMPAGFKHTNSVELIKDAAFKGRICLLNDMRELIGCALKQNGYSLNSTNINELTIATDTVIDWKRYTVKFDNEQYKTGLMSGEFLCVMGYNSDILQVMDESPELDIMFFIPDSGSTCCFDEIVISKDSNNKDLAHKFIDFIYEEKNAAINVNHIFTAVPNKGMIKYLDDSIKNNKLIFPDESMLSKLETLDYLGESLSLYTKFWDKIKSSH